MTATRRPSAVQVRRFRTTDRAAVEALVRARWGGDRTMRWLARIHGGEPGPGRPVGETAVAVAGDTVVGVGSLAGSDRHPRHLEVRVDVAPAAHGPVAEHLLERLVAEADRPLLARTRADDVTGLSVLRRHGFAVAVRTLDRTVDPRSGAVQDWIAATADLPAGVQVLAVGSGFGAAAPVEHAARAHAARYRRTHAWSPPAPMSTAEARAAFCGPDVVPGTSVAAVDRHRALVGVSELVRSPVRPDRALLVWTGVLDEDRPDAERLSATLAGTSLRAGAARGLLVDLEVDDSAPGTWRVLASVPAAERRPDLIVLTTDAEEATGSSH